MSKLLSCNGSEIDRAHAEGLFRPDGSRLMRDSEHPFFRPLWRRIALVVFCAAWCAFEFWNGQAFWGTLAGGMAAYGAWEFLLNYSPKDAAAAADKPEPEADKE